MGWEVKSLREGRVTRPIPCVLQNGEAWLIGTNITPLPTVSTHYVTEPTAPASYRSIAGTGQVGSWRQPEGTHLRCIALYWKNHLVKCEIALAKGKADFDKRQDAKERDWDRQRPRIMRHPKTFPVAEN